MLAYNKIVNSVLETGTLRHEPRTDTNILSTFGLMFEHDLSEGFPLLTGKKMAIKPLLTELEWFIHGRTDLRWLLERGNKIWLGDAFKRFGKDYADFLEITTDEMTIEKFADGVLNDREFFDDDCDLGPIYGAQWRGTYSHGLFTPPDQLREVINSLMEAPTARRHLVVSWNPLELNNMVLPPCHYAFQFYVRWDTNGQKFLDMMWSQRSCDVALGLPFNIGSYALLQLLVAKEIGALGGVLRCSIGDAHIYESHIEGLKEQVMREPLPLPTVDLSDTDLWNFRADHVKVNDYVSHDRIIFKLYN